MSRPARARLALLGAGAFAVVFLALELPLGQLLGEHRQLASLDAELAKLHTDNAALGATVRSLDKPATIAAIAHADYGLIKKGERSFVVLPSAGSGATADPLATTRIAPSDLVPPAASALELQAAPSTAPLDRTGLWGRFLNGIEFWRWAF